MVYDKTNCIYFSATNTTRKIVSAVSQGIRTEKSRNYDLLRDNKLTANIPATEIALFGIPVYSGRVPSIITDSLRNFKGNHTPAIIVCVYGNRDFEDALLELRDIVEANGFVVISAGAFIAQHSIFPQVAKGRPDAEDLNAAVLFGKKSMNILQNEKKLSASLQIAIKGNFPYRKIKTIPLTPKKNTHCNSCGLCAKQCPTQAIDFTNPKKINKQSCISCAHCISICPRKATYFGGILYRLASSNFGRKYTTRQTPYIVYK